MTRDPQDEVTRRWLDAVPPQQLRTLRSMAVRVQAHLHERMRNRALPIWDESVCQNERGIVVSGGGKPRGLLRLSGCISLNEFIERGRVASLVLENKR